MSVKDRITLQDGHESFVPKIVLVSIIVILIIGGIGMYSVLKKQAGEKPMACTLEAKICPDGSAVGRTGPNCEFASCPGEIDTFDFTQSEVEGWQTYRNEEYGFEFEYLGEWYMLNVGPRVSVRGTPFTKGDDVPSFVMSVNTNFDLLTPEEYILTHIKSVNYSEECVFITVSGLHAVRCDPTITLGGHFLIVIGYGEKIFIINDAIRNEITEQMLLTFQFFEPQEKIDLSDLSLSDIEGWQTYRNEEYGFEVKYPSNFNLKIPETDPFFPDFIRWRILLTDYLEGDCVDSIEWYVYDVSSEYGLAYVKEYDNPNVKKIYLGENNVVVEPNTGSMCRYQDVFILDQDDHKVINFNYVGQEYHDQIFYDILKTFRSFTSTQTSFTTSGTVYGKVSIGPLCPVEPCLGTVPDVYSGKQLIFTPTGGGRSIGLPLYADLASDGSYSIELPESNYSVTLDDCQYLGCQYGFPKSIFVEANKMLEFDIDIDTGIR